ncbi:RNA polymerase sigma factor [Aporhodopirellula aestuarii]|uniref:RNA polymerase sigma factor n=1 Tax=Aporhodopirellula aestuarii TaxID=2950107 RepID=A0ABT0TZ54_9BACT|nr:RNA polymerase sigma factor [Aporhodopirellula aestuarii]MCM2369845.1 RNA polymerase sigma factor [Aporhodopirellula aestuarii]
MLQETPRVNRSDDAEASEASLRELFDSEETSLLRYAFSLTGRRAVAEEIVQDVFLQLHIHWDTVETPRAWLVRGVRNRAFDLLRKHQREVLDGIEHEPQSDGTCQSPESMLSRIELTGALRNLIAQLDETDRKLVTLKYFKNLPYREISDQTGLSVGNVGYRLHHILKELAVKMRPLGIDNLS